MGIKLNPVRAAMLNSIRRAIDVIPLYRSGMLSKEEAIKAIETVFPMERSFSVIQSIIGHQIMDPKDNWIRDTMLEWAKNSPEGVESAIEWGVYSAEELKPLIFLHLTRMFMEDRPKNDGYLTSGAVLYHWRKSNYLTAAEEEKFIHSVFLFKSDIKAYQAEVAMA